jgi:hypothetical protein
VSNDDRTLAAGLVRLKPLRDACDFVGCKGRTPFAAQKAPSLPGFWAWAGFTFVLTPHSIFVILGHATA